MQVYQHYKNRQYYLLIDDNVMHTETGEIYVYYKALYGEGKTFLRPKKMFFEDVLDDIYIVPRFRKVLN